MATQTSNLGLTKPAYSETADINDINNNMDKVDAAVNGVQNGMAILANGNVHSAVTSGQYVYVRNHGTLAEGLYTATMNISTNATLSTSNLTAVPNNGALNTLRDDITSLNSNLGNQAHGLTAESNVTLGLAYKAIAGAIKCYNIRITATAQITADTTLVSGFDAPALNANGGAVGLGYNNATKESKTFFLAGDGTLRCAEALANGTDWRINLVYRA